MTVVQCWCHICNYEFRIGAGRDEERLACPICYERFFEELGRKEGDDYSCAGELPLHQMSPTPAAHLMETMNDGPPPSFSSDPMVLVRGFQYVISEVGLHRRTHGHGHMEDYGLGQLIQYLNNASGSGSQSDMTRCGPPPAAHSAVDAIIHCENYL
ncbi:hypothetical protein KI387_015686, partial [Taxus chinensis]